MLPYQMAEVVGVVSPQMTYFPEALDPRTSEAAHQWRTTRSRRAVWRMAGLT
jgi:hypothetical protein